MRIHHHHHNRRWCHLGLQQLSELPQQHQKKLKTSCRRALLHYVSVISNNNFLVGQLDYYQGPWAPTGCHVRHSLLLELVQWNVLLQQYLPHKDCH